MAHRVIALLGASSTLASAASSFLTSEAEVRAFQWTAPLRSVEEAFEGAFPPSKPWKDIHFKEGSETVWTRPELSRWISDELLGGPDPFAGDGGVPLPWPAESEGDQLSPGHWVAYSRRQICFIAAQSLLGATTEGFQNGLQRWLHKETDYGCVPRKDDMGKSLFVLLASCAADPGLKEGGQGPVLLAAKAKGYSTSMEELRTEAESVELAEGGLRVCQYGDGAKPLKGVDKVPEEGCRAPQIAGHGSGPGRDFMTGGPERLEGQGIVDISAAFIGGYVYGNACGLGGGQDERLMVYMPEVAALAFFLSEDAEHPQLRQPAWILGARMLFVGLDGTGRFDARLEPDAGAAITSDLVTVALKGSTYQLSSSRPFIAFMSENQGVVDDTKRPPYDMHKARLNRFPPNREVDPSVSYSFDHEVRAWYRAVALNSYNDQVQPILRRVVKSLGTGPWLAGLWWGDSQVGFLAVWLGHALAAKTWGTGSSPLPVDYYIYSEFTENPGNQCFVHSGRNCGWCFDACNTDPLPPSAFWMPDTAFMGQDRNPCVGYSSLLQRGPSCGGHGIEHVVAGYAGKAAHELWADVVETLTRCPSDKDESVFDLLMTPESCMRLI